MLAKTVQVPGVDISQHTSLFYSVRQTRFDIESRVSLLVCFSKNLSQCHWKFKRVVWYFFLSSVHRHKPDLFSFFLRIS